MKIFFWLLSVIIVVFFSYTASAQKTRQKNNDAYPKISLRTSLTSLLDYDAGIMLGINYRWSKNFSASFEPTWIFFNGFDINDDEKTFPSGIKIRSDVRYHFDKRSKRSPDFFLAPEFHYKKTNTEREDQFGINCQNGQCAYFQNAFYTEQKNEIGGLLKIGMTTPLSFIGKNDRWLFELYTGVGSKQLKIKETNLPVGGSFVNPPDRNILNFGNSPTRNTFNRPLLPFGFKLAFTIK